MSFDPWVWREDEPVTTDQALLKYRWLTAAEEWTGPRAGDDGLVCFDPQAIRVHNPPEIVTVDGPHLVCFDGGAVNEPRAEDLHRLKGRPTVISAT